MPIAPDDPRLTAYALGELDAADRPEIEASLAADPEARAFLEEIRETARLLGEVLRDEPRPALEPEHHLAIESCLTSELRPARKPRRRWAELAVAASLIGLSAVLVYPRLRPSKPLATAQLALNVLAPESARTLPEKPARSQGATIRLWGEHDQPGAVPSPSTSVAPVTPENVVDGYVLAKPDMPISTDGSQGAVNGKGDSRPHPAGQPRGSTDYIHNELSLNNFRTAASLRSSTPGPLLLPGKTVPGQPDTRAGAAPPPSAAGASRPLGRTMLREAESLATGKLESKQRAVEKQDRNATAEEYRGRAKVVEAGSPGQPDALRSSKAKDLKQVDVKLQLEGVSLLAAAQDRARRMKLEAEAGGEVHLPIVDHTFLPVRENPLSTFSIDVDTASYSNVRRYLNQNTRPPADAVRIEELVNYFPYHDPAPVGDEPFSVRTEVARCPWDAGHRLVRIGLKGREIRLDRRPPSNLVFLIDVSGSMQDIDKLPLLKAGMKLLVEQLGENDRVSIVVYAQNEGLVLDSTRADRKAEILSSLEQLQAGGSTDGGRGILLAYDVAVKNFIPGGTNRVILATDGDFNVGVTEGPELDRLIEEKRKTGVFLSVLGFGQGNVKHDKLENLADKGNGQYCYIDSIREARKVLVEQMGGTLVTIAKDVKIQVVFDPEKTSDYRLIGYENRKLQDRDFEDDKKDAGEIGAGHSVTAFYEVVPTGQGPEINSKLRASQLAQQAAKGNAQLLEVRLRYKTPDGEVSKLITRPADDDGRDFSAASVDFRFASSVVGFGMLLRDSPHKGSLTWDGLIELASGSMGGDPGGYRKEFLELARKARSLEPR